VSATGARAGPRCVALEGCRALPECARLGRARTLVGPPWSSSNPDSWVELEPRSRLLGRARTLVGGGGEGAAPWTPTPSTNDRPATRVGDGHPHASLGLPRWNGVHVNKIMPRGRATTIRRQKSPCAWAQAARGAECACTTQGHRSVCGQELELWTRLKGGAPMTGRAPSAARCNPRHGRARPGVRVRPGVRA